MAPDLIHSVKKGNIEWMIQYTEKKENLYPMAKMPNLSLPDHVLKNVREVFTILQERVDSRGPDRLDIIEERYRMGRGGKNVTRR